MALAPRPSPFYRPELDVLRFFAFLSVFVHHAVFPRTATVGTAFWVVRMVAEAGGFGLCLFFLLSSYLITELLWREREQTGGVHLRQFYIRRILRIWPLYFGAIGLCFIGGRWIDDWWLSRTQVLAFIFLAGNWFYSLHKWDMSPVGPLWSISVEEQFYLIWPAVMKLGIAIPVAIATIPASMAMLCFLAFKQVSVQRTIWTNSVVQFLFFGLGALICVYLRSRPMSRALYKTLIWATVGAACWLLAAAGCHILASPEELVGPAALCAGYLLVGAGSISLLIAALTLPTSMIPNWLIYLGKVSFGLYVFHELGLQIAPRIFPFSQSVIGFGITVGLAYLSYEFFEKPFLRLKEKFAFVHSRAA